MTESSTTRVRVRAPARLHLGFLDLHGGTGRRFGGLGLGVDGPVTELELERAESVQASGPGAARAREFLETLLRHYGITGGARLELSSAIPEHSGLGSGTQLALAVGTALARLYGLPAPAAELARVLGRGRRSGIGIGTFLHGGFIVDGGCGPETPVPPVIAHLPFPDTWRLVLVMDGSASGIAGRREAEAFASLPPMAEETAAQLCRLVVMQVLPALAERDCERFGAGIAQVQEIVGAYFAAAQGGPYLSGVVQEAVAFLKSRGASGVGQSSWGPTGFALFAGETRAFQALREARRRWPDSDAPGFVLCRADNLPAAVSVDDRMLRIPGRR